MPSYEAKHAEFERLDAQVVGISIDSIPCHRAWARSLGGIASYPLLADFHPKGEVARRYGVYREADGYAERAIFLIDKAGVVRYIDVHEIGEQPETRQILDELARLAGS
jgi:alkyl hydroperoxide reductase subunit AhpC